jgi:hypothetical protein
MTADVPWGDTQEIPIPILALEDDVPYDIDL